MATGSLTVGAENNRSDFMLTCPFSYLGVKFDCSGRIILQDISVTKNARFFLGHSVVIWFIVISGRRIGLDVYDFLILLVNLGI